MILFGSRTENKENQYPDYDILLILNKDYEWELKRKIRDATYNVNVDFDIVIETKKLAKTNCKLNWTTSLYTRYFRKSD